jgi:hypothetical protein
LQEEKDKDRRVLNKPRILKGSSTANDSPDELFGILGLWPLRGGDEGSKGKNSKGEEDERHPLIERLIDHFQGDDEGSSKGRRKRGRRRVKAEQFKNKIARQWNEMNDEERERALKLAENGEHEELFGRFGIFPIFGGDESSKGKNSKGKNSKGEEDERHPLIERLIDHFQGDDEGSSKGRRRVR